MCTTDVASTSCVAVASDADGALSAVFCEVSIDPESVAMVRSLWDEYRLVLALDWSDAEIRLAGVNSPPAHSRFSSAPPTDLDPVSDAGDCIGPDLALSGLEDLEYVTMRVTGGIISGANGAEQTNPQFS